jgi:hypothetical protein
MVVKQYELAIELSDGGEWICDVTEHNENDVLRYVIEVDPPLFRDGDNIEPFLIDMHYAADGQLVFVTEHPLTEHLEELEPLLATEIIEGSF